MAGQHQFAFSVILTLLNTTLQNYYQEPSASTIRLPVLRSTSVQPQLTGSPVIQHSPNSQSSGNAPAPIEIGNGATVSFTPEQLENTVVQDLQRMLNDRHFMRQRMANSIQYTKEVHAEVVSMRGHLESLSGNIRRTTQDMVEQVLDGDRMVETIRDKYLCLAPHTPPPRPIPSRMILPTQSINPATSG